MNSLSTITVDDTMIESFDGVSRVGVHNVHNIGLFEFLDYFDSPRHLPEQ